MWQPSLLTIFCTHFKFAARRQSGPSSAESVSAWETLSRLLRQSTHWWNKLRAVPPSYKFTAVTSIDVRVSDSRTKHRTTTDQGTPCNSPVSGMPYVMGYSVCLSVCLFLGYLSLWVRPRKSHETKEKKKKTNDTLPIYECTIEKRIAFTVL